MYYLVGLSTAAPVPVTEVVGECQVHQEFVMSSIRCISYLCSALLRGCLTLKIIGLLLRLLRWSEVGSGLQLGSVQLFVPEFRLRIHCCCHLRLMPNASKLFAPIVRGRAQYCVANVRPSSRVARSTVAQLSTGICGAALATPRMHARHRSFRFRGPQAMPCPGPGYGHEPGPCVRLESFVLFDL